MVSRSDKIDCDPENHALMVNAVGGLDVAKDTKLRFQHPLAENPQQLGEMLGLAPSSGQRADAQKPRQPRNILQREVKQQTVSLKPSSRQNFPATDLASPPGYIFRQKSSKSGDIHS